MTKRYRDKATGKFRASSAARRDRTEKTLREWKARPFGWERSTCIHLARAHARNMGHRNLPSVPAMTGPRDALGVLAEMGHASVAALLDAHFERLEAPAFAWVGDLVLVPGDDGRSEPLGAIGIADGQGNIFLWHDAAGTEIAVVKFAQGDVVAGWRL